MKYLFFLLSPFIIFAQEVEREKVVEKVSQFRSKKIYHILKDNPSIRDGLFVELYKKDTISKGVYVNGKREGVWTFNGVKNGVSFTGEYKNDIRVGNWNYKFYGDTSIVSFPETKKYYYKTGELKCSIQKYDKGVKHGKAVFYFKNGQVHQELSFEEDKLILSSDVFNYKGEILRKSSLSGGNGRLFSYDLSENNLENPTLDCKRVLTLKDGLRNGMAMVYKNQKLKSKGVYLKDHKAGVWTYLKRGKQVQENHVPDFNRTVVHSDYFMFKAEKNSTNECSYPLSFIGDKRKSSMTHFSEKLNSFITDEFDMTRVKDLPKGEYRAILVFTINSLGEVDKCKVKSKSFYAGVELERIVKSLPRMNPLILESGVPGDLLFQLPLVFRNN
ncbi:hypothetical protein N9901_02985 [Flavobacteriaceae bacterium]|nr:hypothetical protein [Flavobacteriaceae bacterium]